MVAAPGEARLESPPKGQLLAEASAHGRSGDASLPTLIRFAPHSPFCFPLDLDSRIHLRYGIVFLVSLVVHCYGRRQAQQTFINRNSVMLKMFVVESSVADED